jgi:hypothetical protein
MPTHTMSNAIVKARKIENLVGMVPRDGGGL